MRKKIIFGFVTIFLLALVTFGLKSGFTFRQVVRDTAAFERELPRHDFTPHADPERLNILLLGIRGVDDPNGGLLTDSMVLVSIQKSSRRVALLALPRDIYLLLPNGARGRINSAYALGEAWHWGGGGLVWARHVAEQASGVQIDYAFVIDLSGLKDIVDALGGVSVVLEKPFEEKTQWAGNPGFASNAGAFVLPAGRNVLDGETAMFYVRSRFSTSDFDRARRIQQVMFAIREKASRLGFATSPLRTLRFLDALGSHVRTDASRQELKALLALGETVSFDAPTHLALDDSENGFLKAETINGAYVLLPRDGTFEGIREKVKNIFNE